MLRICCQDLATALRYKVMKEAHQGFCFIVREDRRDKLVPIHFCPWCKTEHSTEGSRPIVTTYPA